MVWNLAWSAARKNKSKTGQLNEQGAERGSSGPKDIIVELANIQHLAFLLSGPLVAGCGISHKLPSLHVS